MSLMTLDERTTDPRPAPGTPDATYPASPPFSRAGVTAWAMLVLAAAAAVGLAPTEETMGHSQRVMYVHVAVAWLALLGFVVVAATGLLYLLKRELAWDDWSQAAAEVGWVCSSLTLATGSLWAHAAWGAWWTWDPRLVTSFVLWSLYGGYLLTRGRVDDPHGRARVAAVLAVLGVLDVPLVVMATRWFRALHPVAPTLEPAMRLALLLSFACFAVFATLLVVGRRAQLRLERRLRTLEREVGL